MPRKTKGEQPPKKKFTKRILLQLSAEVAGEGDDFRNILLSAEDATGELHSRELPNLMLAFKLIALLAHKTVEEAEGGPDELDRILIRHNGTPH